jgi:hypothetical protein
MGAVAPPVRPVTFGNPAIGLSLTVRKRVLAYLFYYLPLPRGVKHVGVLHKGVTAQPYGSKHTGQGGQTGEMNGCKPVQ